MTNNIPKNDRYNSAYNLKIILFITAIKRPKILILMKIKIYMEG